MNDDTSTNDICTEMRELLVTGPYSVVQTCGKRGEFGRRQGMLYIQMPSGSIGRKYRVTYEAIRD